jgi:hypothetical protein
MGKSVKCLLLRHNEHGTFAAPMVRWFGHNTWQPAAAIANRRDVAKSITSGQPCAAILPPGVPSLQVNPFK